MLNKARITSYSVCCSPVAKSQMSCRTQLEGSEAAMVEKMASLSSFTDLLPRRNRWPEGLTARRANDFSRIPAPIKAATGKTAPAVPEAKIKFPVTISGVKKASAKCSEAMANTAEVMMDGFIVVLI